MATELRSPPEIVESQRLEVYQDILIDGEVACQGRRGSERYDLIRPVLERYRRPFTVLDLGANLGYFGLSIIRDFPQATVVAVESGYSNSLLEVLSYQQDAARFILLNTRLTTQDIHQLADVEHFDVVLALSFIHHLDTSPEASLEAMLRLGDNLIIEVPTEEQACGQHHVQNMVEMPRRAIPLGETRSHLGGLRPIYRIPSPKRSLERAYIGSPQACDVRIDSTFDHKRISRPDRPVRDYIRGINLATFEEFGGSHPTRPQIKAQLERNPPTSPHNDIQPWNVIVQGDDTQLIDFNDPLRKSLADETQWHKLLSHLDED